MNVFSLISLTFDSLTYVKVDLLRYGHALNVAYYT